MRKILSFLCMAFLLAGVLAVPAAAAGGQIYVNGAAFQGSFAQAVEAAMPGGLVEIEGRVFTRPVGWQNITVADVTIQGRGAGACLALEPFYFGDYNSKCDVLTVRGDHVTVKNLTINAGLRVDFPLRVFGSDVLVEDVTCLGGLRGAVNVLGMRTGKTQTYRRVRANSSSQGGFYFDDDIDCTGLTLEDCSTQDNLRVGVLVRNSYEAVIGLDLSGVACREGVWAIEDRVAGTIGGAARTEIQIVNPPTDAGGSPIPSGAARYIPFIENSGYRHYRFDRNSAQLWGAKAKLVTARYGFQTELYYASPQAAAEDAMDGERVAALEGSALGNVVSFLRYGFGSLWRALKLWLPAVYF